MLFIICSPAMEDKLRDKLRLMIGIKLALLPRWVKHDFWRQVQPQNGLLPVSRTPSLGVMMEPEVDHGTPKIAARFALFTSLPGTFEFHHRGCNI
jgi:hypothetical protein